MPTTHVHHLVVPAWEGGEIVFAHAQGNGVRVWMRSLVRHAPEPDSRVRQGAAPLYGGSLNGGMPLRDFLLDYLDQPIADGPPARLVPAARNVMPLVRRTQLDHEMTRRHFAIHVLPMHTCGPWEGAAPELLLSRTRGLPSRESVGYFATGLPELPQGIEPDMPSADTPAVMIGRDDAVDLVAFLSGPAGPVLDAR